MKALRKISAVAVASALLLVSCQKADKDNTTDQSPNQVESSKELNVEENFDFKTETALNYNLALVNSKMSGKYRVDIFDAVPNAAQSGLLKTVLLNPNGQVNGNLAIPSGTQKVYLRVAAPDGSSYFVEKELSGNNLNIQLGDNGSGKKGKTTVVSPDCNSGCDQTLSSSRISINSNIPGNVFCLKSGTYGSVSINKAGATLRVCGNVNMGRVSLNNGSSIEITDNSTVQATSLSLNSSNGSLTIYSASLSISGNFTPSGQVINHGTLTVQNEMSVNAQASLVNHNQVNVGTHFKNNGQSVTNNGTMDIGGDYRANGNSNTVNNCKILIGDDLDINSDFENSAFVDVEDNLTVNNGPLTMKNSAQLDANRATFNGRVNATGATSLIRLVASNQNGNSLKTTINGGGQLNGNLEYCDSDGIEALYGSINAPAVESCAVYIPTSGCNAEGNGTPQIVDADNDGVADKNDAYPNDPQRAANSYYPSSSEFATLAFEDLWPNQGDYDFNDMVVDYQYKKVLNANNEVVDIEASYVTRAIGGSFSNGFGIELDVAPSAVSSVSGQQLNEGIISNSGNGTESNQSNAVIIAFDNGVNVLPNPGTPFVNTVEGSAYVTPDTLTMTIALSSPQTENALGSAPYNPFIFVDGDRGREVHLADNAPTDLANQALLGTGDDDSNSGNGRYYKTSGNLPWAINIVGGFDYPEEKEDIVKVYNNYATWAQSGGSQAKDCYLDHAGNINDNVYTQQ